MKAEEDRKSVSIPVLFLMVETKEKFRFKMILYAVLSKIKIIIDNDNGNMIY